MKKTNLTGLSKPLSFDFLKNKRKILWNFSSLIPNSEFRIPNFKKGGVPMENSFFRLAPFINEYVEKNGWASLRPVQESAISVILDTKDNLLLSCGTSSGKTEAAFFPILTKISKEEKSGVSVLYIAPLKALINDQFERISEICRSANIPVCHRHGDVSGRSRQDLLENPSGILQITPEALEGLLMRHGTKMRDIFGSLRFVVIDELHALLGNDRGSQVLCLIERIMKSACCRPRIVALSATIGDTSKVCALLSVCNGRKTACPKFPDDKFSVSLLLETFEKTEDRNSFVYEAVKKKNSLVFAPSRSETEKITSALGEIMAAKGDSGDVFIHHGSISAPLRRDAEKALKSAARHSVICATSTLELGIDIGRLERVVSLGAVNTVSSFLQRLGRSGRRGNTPEMLWAFSSKNGSEKDEKFSILPFELLQSIAIVELYRRERYIEPADEKKYPFGLACHQTLSHLCENPLGLTPSELSRNILSLSPLKSVSIDDYKKILSHLYEKGYIDKTDDGRIIVGLSGEKLCSSFKFYSVFRQEASYKVVDEGGGEIGSVSEAVMPGGKFTLAGRTWVCERIDMQSHLIYARLSGGKVSSMWHGSLTELSDRIAQFVKVILSEEEVYSYLGENAKKALIDARVRARNMGILDYPLMQLSGDTFIITPFFGSRAMNTLLRCVRSFSFASKVAIENPYVLSFRMSMAEKSSFTSQLRCSIIENKNFTDGLLLENENCFVEKYDYLVPPQLLRKAYICDRLDGERVLELVKKF